MKGGRSVYDPHFAVKAAFGGGDECWKEVKRVWIQNKNAYLAEERDFHRESALQIGDRSPVLLLGRWVDPSLR